MIIVSQDKREIINFENITEIVVEDNQITITDDVYKEYGEIIGNYATEERAKEVLQGIIRAYEKAGNIMFETDKDERLLKLTHNSNVFEMPEE